MYQHSLATNRYPGGAVIEPWTAIPHSLRRLTRSRTHPPQASTGATIQATSGLASLPCVPHRPALFAFPAFPLPPLSCACAAPRGYHTVPLPVALLSAQRCSCGPQLPLLPQGTHALRCTVLCSMQCPRYIPCLVKRSRDECTLLMNEYSFPGKLSRASRQEDVRNGDIYVCEGDVACSAVLMK